jgi:branched-chain amino acid aminotransferase
MTHSTHAYAPDPRNETILIDVNGTLFPRHEAKVSVFDSGFVLGDGVWEGLRVYPGPDGRGVIAFLDRHLKRLWEGAKTLDFDMGLTRAELARRLYDCLDANNAHAGVHIRLMVSRGVKSTP